jgi:hypothetical protein
MPPPCDPVEAERGGFLASALIPRNIDDSLVEAHLADATPHRLLVDTHRVACRTYGGIWAADQGVASAETHNTVEVRRTTPILWASPSRRLSFPTLKSSGTPSLVSNGVRNDSRYRMN